MDGTKVAWQFIQEHWEELNEKYHGAKVGSLVCASIRGFQSYEDADAVETFFQHRKTSSFQRQLENTVEEIRTHAGCYLRDVEPLAQWLANHHG
jgi:hypothetical protein